MSIETFDLGADVVELAAYVPTPTAPLREMPFQRNAWTPDQIDTLRTMFAADASVTEIAETVGRPFHATRTKICDLGLRRNSCRPWTEFEDAELVRRYENEAAAQLALELGRGVSAIYARAHLLGLSEQNPAWTGWEDAQLRAGYETGVPVPQLAVLIGRPLSGVLSHAALIGLRHKNKPADWSDEEMGRALELAQEGHIYRKIATMLAAEGFPERNKNSMKSKLAALGYGRGWGRRWLEDEDELLRRAYANGDSLTPLCARLGRTRTSIAHRSGELGLRGTHSNPNGFCRGPVWSAEEEQFLRDRYADTPGKELEHLLDRPIRSIYQRAHHLGLSSSWMREFTADEDRAIGIAWRHGISMVDLSIALGRDKAVVGKHATRIGFVFSDPNKPKAPMTRRASRTIPTLAEILALEPNHQQEQAA